MIFSWPFFWVSLSTLLSLGMAYTLNSFLGMGLSAGLYLAFLLHFSRLFAYVSFPLPLSVTKGSKFYYGNPAFTQWKKSHTLLKQWVWKPLSAHHSGMGYQHGPMTFWALLPPEVFVEYLRTMATQGALPWTLRDDAHKIIYQSPAWQTEQEHISHTFTLPASSYTFSWQETWLPLPEHCPMALTNLSGTIVHCNQAFSRWVSAPPSWLKRWTTASQKTLILHMSNTSGGPVSCMLHTLTGHMETLWIYPAHQTTYRWIFKEALSLEDQRLKTLGHLAGTVAHDFNNLLTAMVGFCDLALENPTLQDIHHIKDNALRAMTLVRQLLLFVRQEDPPKATLNVTHILKRMEALICQLLGPGITMKIEGKPQENLWIRGNQGYFEQALLNLAINARDAMKPQKKGYLSLRAEKVSLTTPSTLKRGTLSPGCYVKITVADTGPGISQEDQEKIFAPYYSTKESGEGTGLGLSTVVNVVEGFHGGIDIQSAASGGTQFILYFPWQNSPKHTTSVQPSTPPAAVVQKKRIMVVDDEHAVRLFTVRALGQKGYEVIEARSGRKALQLLQQKEVFDLVITDAAMPGVDGGQVAVEAQKHQASTRILFVSGYPEETLRQQFTCPRHHVFFLPKPFELKTLLHTVEQVLGTC